MTYSSMKALMTKLQKVFEENEIILSFLSRLNLECCLWWDMVGHWSNRVS